MRLRPRMAARRGAALVEAGIVLPVLITLVIGMIDLGLAVSRSQMVAQAAREVSRLAMVRGSLAPSAMGSWGPTTYGPSAANSSDAIAQAAAPRLAGLNAADVTLKLEWLDGNNQEESRVRVTVTTTYQPMLTAVFGGTPISLSSTSTVRITH